MLAPGKPSGCGGEADRGRQTAPPSASAPGGAGQGRALSFPVPGLEEVWAETQGDERVCVALLDGPVDRSHPSLLGANLRPLPGPAPALPDDGPACRHGTHVASVIFGQPGGPVAGIAPRCRGVAVSIFESSDESSFRPASQLDLARALTAALLAGADVINVSGGELSPTGTAHPLLSDVVRRCAEQGVLIVAAAGNQGCACPHVPAALDAVLAVGAMNARGEPLPFSNWGGAYRTQGLLAPGEAVLGATPGGGSEWATGTSYAAAVVSGVAALLLSLQLRRGQTPDPRRVRAALLAGARRHGTAADPRSLAGALDIRTTVSLLFPGRPPMSDPNDVQASSLSNNHDTAGGAAVSPPPSRLAGVMDRTGAPAAEAAEPPPQRAPRPTEAKSPSCGCGAAAGAPPLAYALGQIGYDFPGEARLDSLAQKMAAEAGVAPSRALAYDPGRMLEYLKKNPWDAASVEWTLSLDGTPLYALRPRGPFAADGYAELRRFLRERIEEGVERISVPGVVAGQATLLSGQRVPVIVPELRGMYSWTTAALADAVAGPAPAGGADGDGHARRREAVRNFLARVYHEVRNLGLTPQDRALNYVATNAFEMGVIFADALRERMELDQVAVTPSPVGRPGSDCWDVEVYFFYPERQVQTVRKVYRFTVDVSDTVPVTVGTMRSWFAR